MYTQCWSTVSQKNGISQLQNFKSLKIHRLYFDVDCQEACVKTSQYLIMGIPMSKEYLFPQIKKKVFSTIKERTVSVVNCYHTTRHTTS